MMISIPNSSSGDGFAPIPRRSVANAVMITGSARASGYASETSARRYARESPISQIIPLSPPPSSISQKREGRRVRSIPDVSANGRVVQRHDAETTM